MQYDEVSFLAGLAAGRQLKGWATHVVKGDTKTRDAIAFAYGNMSTYGKYEISDSASLLSISPPIIANVVSSTFELSNPPKQISGNVTEMISLSVTATLTWSVEANNPPKQVVDSASALVDDRIAAIIQASMEVDENA